MKKQNFKNETIFQEDEDDAVLATRLAVRGLHASYPGIGGGPLPTGFAAPILVPTPPLSPNGPTGPVDLLGPLSAAGPYTGLLTGTKWKPFPEVHILHLAAV